jgi:type II secretory pathway pseudopilin PulG
MAADEERKARAISLIELVAILTLVGIMAAIVVPHVSVSHDTAQQKANAHNKAVINATIERWYIDKGTWPTNDLKDISDDSRYFPNGLPRNPIDNSAYSIDPSTHRVN